MFTIKTFVDKVFNTELLTPSLVRQSHHLHAQLPVSDLFKYTIYIKKIRNEHYIS